MTTKKTETLGLRLSPEDRDLLKSLADAAGMTQAQWLRATLRAPPGDQKPAIVEALERIAAAIQGDKQP